MSFEYNSDLFYPIVTAIGEIIHNTHSADNLMLYCQFIKALLDSSELSAALLTNIFEINLQIWETIAGSNSSAIHQSIGVTIIEILFHSKIMAHASASEKLGDQLAYIASQIVPMGYARRLVLPTLASHFHEFLNSYPDKFISEKWIASILVDIYCIQQNRDNLFVIDESIVEICIADGLVIDAGTPEATSKAHVITILGHAAISQSFGIAVLDAIDAASPPLFAPDAGEAAASELQRVHLSELLLLVADFIPEIEQIDYINRILELLRSEFSPRVRTSLEWTIARLIYRDSKNKGLLDSAVWYPLSVAEDRPRYLDSILTIAVLIARANFTDKNADEALTILNKLCPILIAFATTNRAVLRHGATSLLLGIKRIVMESPLPESIKTIVQTLEQHVLASPSFGTFKYGEDILWDINADFSILSVSGAVSASVSDQVKLPRYELSYELLVMSSFNNDAMRVPKFSEKQILAAAVKTNVNQNTKHLAKLALTQISTTADNISTTTSTLQTKSNTRISTPRPVRSTKGRMIVLASLVDKAPNLGGICRLADVLGAELLCIPDMNFAKNKEFQAVAVTADRWMPMKEVDVASISKYLQECRADGYKIWGMEQTDDSVVLTAELKFPEKVVLILGKEKEGIPPELLRELDCAVEIKQTGVVRSMNIQTATAVVVHAYSMQHC